MDVKALDSMQHIQCRGDNLLLMKAHLFVNIRYITRISLLDAAVWCQVVMGEVGS